ncbi:unnamed protein product [Penicillium salamii]|uniref:Uncharacterized protein n=1 Tax=Penicillium salamii TaxID=1612424 RepID=A0A9W4ISA4_9EURO|nr:unnamed protein product [Penicillium salamii]
MKRSWKSRFIFPLKAVSQSKRRSDSLRINSHPLKEAKFRPLTCGDDHLIAIRREDDSWYEIVSGNVFTLEMTDKKARPLPSFDLLELRWHLTRIAVMQGRSPDDDIGDESDDGYSTDTSL